MVEIDTPQAGDIDCPLELEDVDRKAAYPGPTPRLTLGEPIVIQLTKALLEKDPEAVASLQQSGKHTFHLVRLACTFRPFAEEQFKEAWLRVLCEPAEGTIAWSMLPQRDADLYESSSKVSLGADIKLLGVGFKAGGEGNEKKQRVRPFIDAHNLQQNDPQWQFRATSARDLEGSFPLALVLRSLKETPCVGKLSVRCTVERKRLGLFTFISAVTAPHIIFKIHA